MTIIAQVCSILLIATIANPTAFAAENIDSIARKLISEHRLQEAAVMEQKAYQADPKNVTHCKMLTYIYSQQGRSDALRYAQEAVKLAPKDASTHFNLASVSMQFGLGKQASEEYRAAYELDPNNTEIVIGYADFLRTARHQVEAAEVLEDLLEKKPNDIDILKAATSIYLDMEDMTGADEAITKALKVAPNDYIVNFLAARVKLAEFDFDQARELSAKLIKMQPQNPDGYRMAARCSTWNANRPQDASEVVQSAVTSIPGNGELFSDLGKLFQSKGNSANPNKRGTSRANKKTWYELAERCYRMAVRANPRNPNYLLDLAGYLALQHRGMEAATLIAAAAKINPDSRLIAYAQRKVGNPKNDIAGSLRAWLWSKRR